MITIRMCSEQWSTMRQHGPIATIFSHIDKIIHYKCFAKLIGTSSKFYMANLHIPLRSGIVNALIWFVVEFLIATLIDEFIRVVHNRHIQRVLSRGEQIVLQEVPIPPLGANLYVRRKQSFIFIALRITLLGMFLAMNLGINGVNLPIYKEVEFNSRFTSKLSLPSYASSRKYFNILSQCIQLNGEEFTVFEPVFNTTKNSGDNSLTNLSELVCLDGEQTQERKVLVTGRVALSLPPLRDREKVEWRYGQEERVRYPGELVSLQLRHIVIGKIGNQSFDHNANVRAAVCRFDRDTRARCLTVLRRENDGELTFNLFESAGVRRREVDVKTHAIALAPSVRMNVTDTKNVEFLSKMAVKLFDILPGRHPKDFITNLLLFYYKPIEKRKQALSKVSKRGSTTEQRTEITKSSLIIMCVVVSISFALLIYLLFDLWCYGSILPLASKNQFNRMDVLTRFLATTGNDDKHPTCVRLSQDNTLHLSSPSH